MIQELLGGVMEERKLSMPVGFISDGSSSPSFTSSPVSSPSMSSAPSEPQQNLRCPRCDSSNTKFCYYNNYNLTQPRHFCKTCRRYWTKGGALRNVPIGGGCRKAKPSPAAAARKPKPPSSDADLLSPAPIVWATPYSSQLLALLRASQFHNPNPNPKSAAFGAGAPTSMMSDPYVTFNEQNSAVDPFGQTWRTPNQYHLYQQQQQQQFQQHEMMMMGEAQGSGIQELLQRLRSSGGYHNAEQPAGNGFGSSASFSTATMATSTTAPIMEPLPLSGGEMSYWNPALPWADVSAMNGGFP